MTRRIWLLFFVALTSAVVASLINQHSLDHESDVRDAVAEPNAYHLANEARWKREAATRPTTSAASP
jgi:hypothetical protein